MTKSSVLPRSQIVTRDDLEKALVEASIRRIKVVEVKAASLMILFVRPKRQAELFNILDERLTPNVSFVIGTLGFWDCLVYRFQYQIL